MSVPSLNSGLGDFYKKFVLQGTSKIDAAATLREALTHPDERLKAHDLLLRLQSLDAQCGGKLENRCYISSIQKLALEEALNG